MARAGQWTIETREPGKPNQKYLFFTIAQSETQAMKSFRSFHKRWRVIQITPPSFPEPPKKKEKKRGK